jgi:glutathione S-transferase
MALPILYSYRRCPYAMRARMALKLANVEVEIREISLREKPAHMLQISPKATVPVLIFPDGKVIDESLEIMLFAFNSAREKNDALQPSIYEASRASLGITLISQNDSEFKIHLDCYKYPERNPNKTQIQHRAGGEVFLQKLENLLQKNVYLHGENFDFADIAIFPFVRQFAAVDANWWESAQYPKLRAWLNDWLNSELFKSVMTKNPTYVW